MAGEDIEEKTKVGEKKKKKNKRKKLVKLTKNN